MAPPSSYELHVLKEENSTRSLFEDKEDHEIVVFFMFWNLQSRTQVLPDIVGLEFALSIFVGLPEFDP